MLLVEALDETCIIVADQRLTFWPHVGYCMCLKDELDWGRLNYIQIKRIREVSYKFFDLVDENKLIFKNGY